MDKTKKKSAPPYMSWLTLSNYLASFQQGVPPKIDKSGMITMSGTNRTYTMSALKYLGLIDASGKPESALEELASLSTPGRQAEYQQKLSGILKTAYSYLFDNDATFNLATSTAGHFSEKFKDQGVAGDTVRKSGAFFLGAAKDAGITVSKLILDARKRGRKAGSLSKPKPRKQKKASKKPGETSVQTGEVANEASERHNLILEKLAASFPEFDPNWDSEAQKAWFEMYGRLLNIADDAETD